VVTKFLDWDDISKEFQNIILLVVVIVVLFVIQFFLNVGKFFSKNPIYLWLVLGIIGAIVVLIIIGYFFGDLLDKSEDNVYEHERELKEKITIKRETKRDIVDEVEVLVNSIKKNINRWKNVIPKITGRRKEKQLTLSMTGYLASSYPDIVLEQKLGGNRIDAVVGKIGIEAKYRPNQSEINRLYGQVDDYLRYLDHIIVVFFDTNQSMINNFKRKIKTGGYNNNVTVINI